MGVSILDFAKHTHKLITSKAKKEYRDGYIDFLAASMVILDEVFRFKEDIITEIIVCLTVRCKKIKETSSNYDSFLMDVIDKEIDYSQIWFNATISEDENPLFRNPLYMLAREVQIDLHLYPDIACNLYITSFFSEYINIINKLIKK